jgi:methionine-rich copper-binding protein CopC
MIRKAFACVALTTSLLCSFAPSVSAHSGVVSTNPEYQTAVIELPPIASVTFGSPVTQVAGTSANTLLVTAPDGATVSVGETLVDGAQISVTLDQSIDQQGIYDVNYRAVFDDGHAVTGSFQFAVASDGVFPKSSTSEPGESHSGLSGFFHVHSTHIYQTFGVLAIIVAWAWYRRRQRS